MSDDDKRWFELVQKQIADITQTTYDEALARGIAKEQARFLLPIGTQTTMYMQGSLRSWIHYLNVRCDKDTQLEHREIGDAIKAELIKQFPSIFEALESE
jgi:thymidylate synthase (FAD)